MIVPGPELILILLIMVVVFGLGKLPAISKKLAQLRLNYEKGVATDIVDITLAKEADAETSRRELEDNPE